MGAARRGGSGGKARTLVGGVGVAEGDCQHVDAGRNRSHARTQRRNRNASLERDRTQARDLFATNVRPATCISTPAYLL